MSVSRSTKRFPRGGNLGLHGEILFRIGEHTSCTGEIVSGMGEGASRKGEIEPCMGEDGPRMGENHFRMGGIESCTHKHPFRTVNRLFCAAKNRGNAHRDLSQPRFSLVSNL